MIREIVIGILTGAGVLIIGMILPKTGKIIKQAIQALKPKAKIEKGTVFTGGLPIFTSPKGYLYTISGVKKLFCADCYKPDYKLVPLKKTGRKYICPSCNKEYKT